MRTQMMNRRVQTTAKGGFPAVALGCLVQALCSFGADWDFGAPPPHLLEAQGHWTGGPVGSTTAANFTPAAATVATVTTATGFTNGNTAVTAPQGDITFSIPQGLTYSTIYYRLNSTSGDWSRVTLTGGGTLMSRSDVSHIGESTPGNRITVNGNSSLNMVNGMNIGNGASSSNNSVSIDHAFLWTTNASASVGNSGSSNRLDITNSGQWVAREINVGNSSSSGRNLLKVTGGGTLTVTTNGTTTFAIQVGRNSGANGNGLIIEGGDSTATVSGYLYSGNAGSYNYVHVLDHGELTVRNDLSLSYNSASAGNSLLIDNAFLWTTNANANVGAIGYGNYAIVTNGAKWVAREMNIGKSAGASNNVITVTDRGSITVTTNGATTYNLNLGTASTANRNGLVVEGGDSTVTVSGAINLSNGLSNYVHVLDGGQVTAKGMTLGTAATGSNNAVRVQNGTVNLSGKLTANHAGSLTLAGTNASVTASVASGAGLEISNGASLRFEFGPAAPADALIDITGSLTASNPGALSVDAKQLARKSGARGICLISLTTASEAALASLTNNFAAAASAGAVTFEIEDGKKLLCNVAGEGETIIMLR